MEAIDFSPLQKFFNNMALQLIILMIICSIAYVVVFLLLRKIKVPKELCNFLASIAFLVAMYYSFMNGFITNIQVFQ